MATIDDVVTNEDILAIANAIRRVTRTSGTMRVGDMPERLLDVRVVEYKEQAYDFSAGNSVQLGTYDVALKHMFLVFPADNASSTLLGKTKPSIALVFNGEGVLSLSHAKNVPDTISLVVVDLLLASDATSTGYVLLGGGSGGGAEVVDIGLLDMQSMEKELTQEQYEALNGEELVTLQFEVTEDEEQLSYTLTRLTPGVFAGIMSNSVLMLQTSIDGSQYLIEAQVVDLVDDDTFEYQIEQLNTMLEGKVDVLTEAPVADNDKPISLVVLASEPQAKYRGYIYYIQPTQQEPAKLYYNAIQVASVDDLVTDYNLLDNVPIVEADLDSITPVAGKYYQHTGIPVPPVLSAFQLNDIVDKISFGDVQDGETSASLDAFLSQLSSDPIFLIGDDSAHKYVMAFNFQGIGCIVFNSNDDIVPLYASQAFSIEDVSFTEGFQNLDRGMFRVSVPMTVQIIDTDYAGWNGVLVFKQEREFSPFESGAIYYYDGVEYSFIGKSVSYTTTPPTEAKQSGIEFVLLSSEPNNKYDGYIYIVKGTTVVSLDAYKAREYHLPEEGRLVFDVTKEADLATYLEGLDYVQWIDMREFGGPNLFIAVPTGEEEPKLAIKIGGDSGVMFVKDMTDSEHPIYMVVVMTDDFVPLYSTGTTTWNMSMWTGHSVSIAQGYNNLVDGVYDWGTGDQEIILPIGGLAFDGWNGILFGTGDVDVIHDKFYVGANKLAYADSIYTKAQTQSMLAQKQDKLESGVNIKTISGQSILGAGDIDTVRFADNLVSPDAVEDNSRFVFRTAGGDASIETGQATIVKILAKTTQPYHTDEHFSLSYSWATSYYPSVDLNTWLSSPAGQEENIHSFNFTKDATGWYLDYVSDYVNLADYGITLDVHRPGSPRDGATIQVWFEYVPADPTTSLLYCSTWSDGTDYFEVSADMSVWRAQVAQSGNYRFSYYQGQWSMDNTPVDLADYGLTVTGTYIDSDEFWVNYVPEELGKKSRVKLTSFKSVGFNLYKYDASDETTYGASFAKVKGGQWYNIEGTYTSVWFNQTKVSAGTGTILYPSVYTVGQYQANNAVYISEDGYIILAGGNDTDTMVNLIWSGYMIGTAYQPYKEFEGIIPTQDKDGAALPTMFLSIGDVSDEIDFEHDLYIQRIGTQAYSQVALETWLAAHPDAEENVDYQFDADYIYTVLDTPVQYRLAASVTGVYDVDDFGIEYFEYVYTGFSYLEPGIDSSTRPMVHILYGSNLRDKLRTDVLTISRQTLTEAQKRQVWENLGLELPGDTEF